MTTTSIATAAGRKLRSLRVRQGISIEQLGQTIGANGDAIHRIEAGARILKFDEAVLLTHRLGVSVDALLTPCDTCKGEPPKGFECQHCGAVTAFDATTQAGVTQS